MPLAHSTYFFTLFMSWADVRTVSLASSCRGSPSTAPRAVVTSANAAPAFGSPGDAGLGTRGNFPASGTGSASLWLFTWEVPHRAAGRFNLAPHVNRSRRSLPPNWTRPPPLIPLVVVAPFSLSCNHSPLALYIFYCCPDTSIILHSRPRRDNTVSKVTISDPVRVPHRARTLGAIRSRFL